MRKIVLAVAVMSLAGGLAYAGVRSKGVRASATSTKSVQSLAECVALRLAQSSGYEIRDSGTGNPREIQLKMRVVGVPAVVGIVAIEDTGSERRLLTFATGKATGAPAVITEGSLACAAS